MEVNECKALFTLVKVCVTICDSFHEVTVGYNLKSIQGKIWPKQAGVVVGGLMGGWVGVESENKAISAFN